MRRGTRVATMAALFVVATAVSAGLGPRTPTALGQDAVPRATTTDSIRPVAALAPSIVALSPVGRYLRSHGYLPRDPAGYVRAKLAAGSGPLAGREYTSKPAANARTPVALRGWAATYDRSDAPPDTTGAAGESSYIEAMNRRVAIYTRSGALVAASGLRAFLGSADSSVTDPQMMWDPGTGVFYFAALNFNNEHLYFGWSKTGNPQALTSSAWCRFAYPDYQGMNEIADFPKLGDTRHFILIGVNAYHDNNFVFRGADVVAIPKPAPGTAGDCTTPASATRFSNLGDGRGVGVFTPVPAAQTDSNDTGYVVTAVPNLNTPTRPNRCGNELALFAVGESGGNPTMSAATRITVLQFNLPPFATQKGTTSRLDTQDCRLTNAMASADPSRGGAIGLWTQHTVKGGGGSEIRWYEIDALAGALIHSGRISNSGKFVFNGAISSDRSVPQSSPGQFGNGMVLGFNTSSKSTYPAIRMVSKVGTGPTSPWVFVKGSYGYNRDFSCGSVAPNVCRWGDYSGASPDPRASTGLHGHVFLANQWDAKSIDNINVDWRTFIWEASP